MGLLQSVFHGITGEVAGAERSADVIRSPETDSMTQGPESLHAQSWLPGVGRRKGAKRLTSGCDSAARGTE